MLFAAIIQFINLLIKIFGTVISILFILLPNSPFQKYIVENDTIRDYVGKINYFVPVTEMIVVLEAWCVAIGVFYVVQIALRWLKAIE